MEKLVIANLATVLPMVKDINLIIDLYAKFLIAFVGIVTPALALYLNNYLINRSKFKMYIDQVDKQINEQIALQKGNLNTYLSEEERTLNVQSNQELEEKRKKYEKWKEIVDRINPKEFFTQNVKLLCLSMFLLFFLLFIRTGKWLDPWFQRDGYLVAAALSALGSVVFCVYHLMTLYRLGLYLIEVRPDVEVINETIKEQRLVTETSPDQVVAVRSNNQLELNFDEPNQK